MNFSLFVTSNQILSISISDNRCRFDSDVKSTLKSGKQTEHPVIERYTICCYVSKHYLSRSLLP